MIWKNDEISVQVTGLKGMAHGAVIVNSEIQQLPTMTLFTLLSLFSTSVLQSSIDVKRMEISTFELHRQFFEYASLWETAAPRATSISPIRSEPKRTYDRSSDEYDPSGDHIPFVLARMLQKRNIGKGQASP